MRGKLVSLSSCISELLLCNKPLQKPTDLYYQSILFSHYSVGRLGR